MICTCIVDPNDLAAGPVVIDPECHHAQDTADRPNLTH